MVSAPESCDSVRVAPQLLEWSADFTSSSVVVCVPRTLAAGAKNALAALSSPPLNAVIMSRATLLASVAPTVVADREPAPVRWLPPRDTRAATTAMRTTSAAVAITGTRHVGPLAGDAWLDGGVAALGGSVAASGDVTGGAEAVCSAPSGATSKGISRRVMPLSR